MRQKCPGFRIIGPEGCPVAQRAALALVLRGQRINWLVGARARLVVEQANGVVMAIEDGLAMIELIEDLHPDRRLHPANPELRASHREIMGGALRAQGALAAVIAARNLRDLDIAVHDLRNRLARIEHALPDGDPNPPLANLDVALLPLLWRIALLDLRHDTHLADGMPRCNRRLAAALRHPAVRQVLDRGAGRRFLEEVARRGAVLALDDPGSEWERHFEPARGSATDGALLFLRPGAGAGPVMTRNMG
ncbi:hypothetical protein LOS78_13180 [Paracoccus sp. MA]|uniref:hypothetical protein n=1 Tax=Paracoccus sp. MA TaxID=2895796 RepID=UPI001E3E06C0|nr:hypothetical protein [Paracoccus sp. MA]UFM64631.1 hypothetical protein LOS78_13180 [Paracoccus sp. MA]